MNLRLNGQAQSPVWWRGGALLSIVLWMGCKLVPPPQPQSLAELVAKTKPADTKVLLVGIDGATFSIIDPLVAAGTLPNFAALLNRGARAPLESENPMISAALWSTMVTGFGPKEHGIEDFRAMDQKTGKRTGRLVSSNDRKTLALWNLLGPFGKSVGFVAWWASWPAEPVHGWIISDRMARGRWSEWLKANRHHYLTFPNHLVEELAPLIVDPEAPLVPELLDLADFDTKELAEMAGAKTPLFAHGPSVTKFAFCAQRSYERMALQQLQKGQPDLTAVYLIAVDPICHTFWHYFEPQKYEPGAVDAQAAARLGKIIPNIYRHNDAFIGELLTLLDPATVVLVVSDHGFMAGDRLPRGKPGAEVAHKFHERMRETLTAGKVTVGQPGTHHRHGVFIAAGAPIRSGATTTATIRDIAPTVLALFGLPVPNDMKGRVLSEIVEPSYWERHPIKRIDSYERLLPREKLPAAGSVDDAQALQLLRALGYIP